MSDVIDFQQHLQSRQKIEKRKQAVDIKAKLENYRTIWNNSPRNSDLEQRSIAKIALLARELPDEDKEKINFIRIAVDFHEDNSDAMIGMIEKLKELTEAVTDKEERLLSYRVLMRNKNTDAQTKEQIGNIMMDILENA